MQEQLEIGKAGEIHPITKEKQYQQRGEDEKSAISLPPQRSENDSKEKIQEAEERLRAEFSKIEQNIRREYEEKIAQLRKEAEGWRSKASGSQERLNSYEEKIKSLESSQRELGSKANDQLQLEREEIKKSRELLSIREKELESARKRIDELERLNQKSMEAAEKEKKDSAKAIDSERQKCSRIIEEERSKANRRVEEERIKFAKELESLGQSHEKQMTEIRRGIASLGPNLLKARGNVRSLSKSCKSFKPEFLAKQKAFLQALEKLSKKGINALSLALADNTERYKKEVKLRKKLFNQIQELKGNIRVYCRARPPLPGEGESIVKIVDREVLNLVDSYHNKTHTYEFERAFGEDSKQEQIFEEVEPLATSVLDGYNVCIFAYGQTGSGKTYTMEGVPEARGVNYRTLSKLFEIRKERQADYAYTFRVAVMEIYNENLLDLLTSTKEKIEIRQSNEEGIILPDLTTVEVDSIESVIATLNRGYKNRATGATNINVHSSRSHWYARFFSIVFFFPLLD